MHVKERKSGEWVFSEGDEITCGGCVSNQITTGSIWICLKASASSYGIRSLRQIGDQSLSLTLPGSRVDAHTADVDETDKTTLTSASTWSLKIVWLARASHRSNRTLVKTGLFDWACLIELAWLSLLDWACLIELAWLSLLYWKLALLRARVGWPHNIDSERLSLNENVPLDRLITRQSGFNN
jgi:hypothetical protein